ncbi:MAG: CoA-binding protein [Deltaproteobacteria bacterium]
MKNTESLDFLFHPQTIAIAGVSEKVKQFNAGLKYLEGLMQFGFKGKLYPMNPAGGEINGMTIYKSVKDIPDKVDFIISAIPAPYTPQLVADAAEKGVRAIHFFTSGFSEIENAEGKRLQADIMARAKKGGIRIVGPNCLGLYCPGGGLSFNADFEKASGPVAMISQSGGNAAHCVQEGNSRGVLFSKVISMGNGADLNESDYLEYLASDEETKIITAYIEGVRQGPRFFKALKAAAKTKPTIILKVGTSASGAEAAVSHTTAMAGADGVWDGILKQTGAVRAGSIEEMMDLTLAFEHLPAPAGNKIVIIGIGGGASVLLADEFTRAGLTLPRLSDKLRQSLMELFSTEAGRIFKNPIDLNNFESADIFLKTMKTLDQSEEADLLLIHVAFDHFGLISIKDKEFMIGVYLELIKQFKKEIGKPLGVILHSYSSTEMRNLALDAGKSLTNAGIAVFPSIQRAAQALGKFADYHEKRGAALPAK